MGLVIPGARQNYRREKRWRSTGLACYIPTKKLRIRQASETWFNDLKVMSCIISGAWPRSQIVQTCPSISNMENIRIYCKLWMVWFYISRDSGENHSRSSDLSFLRSSEIWHATSRVKNPSHERILNGTPCQVSLSWQNLFQNTNQRCKC